MALSGVASSDTTSVTWVNDRGGSGTATGDVQWSIADANLQTGVNNITVTAHSPSGTADAVIAVTYDPTPPTVQITGPTTNPTFTTNDSNLVLSGVAADNVAVDSLWWFSAALNSFGGCTGTTTWQTVGLSFIDGSNPITIFVSDTAGNVVTTSITVTLSLTAHVIAADSGSYTLSGTAAGLTRAGGPAKTIAATGGSYALTGSAAILERAIPVQPGAYALTGSDATLTKAGPKILANAGSYALTGTAATLTRGAATGPKIIAAASGTYALTGSDATLRKTTPPVSPIGRLSIPARRAMNAPETGEVFLLLLTISHSLLVPPLRFVNNTTNITSRGNVFLGCPFAVSLPDERDDQVAPQITITIDNVDRKIMEGIRSLPIGQPPTVTIELIIASVPDNVEQSFPTFTLRQVEYDALVVTGVLMLEDILNEGYPQYEFVPLYFPALFASAT